MSEALLKCLCFFSKKNYALESFYRLRKEPLVDIFIVIRVIYKPYNPIEVSYVPS